MPLTGPRAVSPDLSFASTFRVRCVLANPLRDYPSALPPSRIFPPAHIWLEFGRTLVQCHTYTAGCAQKHHTAIHAQEHVCAEWAAVVVRVKRANLDCVRSTSLYPVTRIAFMRPCACSPSLPLSSNTFPSSLVRGLSCASHRAHRAIAADWSASLFTRARASTAQCAFSLYAVLGAVGLSEGPAGVSLHAEAACSV